MYQHVFLLDVTDDNSGLSIGGLLLCRGVLNLRDGGAGRGTLGCR